MKRMSTALRRPAPLLAVLLTLSPGPATGAPPENDAPTDTRDDARSLTLEDLRAFSDVFNQVRRNFVDTVDERDLIQAAIRGMLSELDPHSAYLAVDQYRDLDDVSRGRYGGVGIRLNTRDGKIRVDAVINGSPADRAGIDVGDIITAVDDVPVRGRPLAETLEGIDGEPGSTVRLSVERPGQPPRDVTLEREFIKLPTLSYRPLSRGWGYFRISQFHRDSATDLAAALASIRDDGTELAGLVLDLRGNPGGVLQPAIDIADGFLDSGRIVSTRGRNPSTRMEFDAAPGQWLPGRPIVLLVDRRSASAAEVLAGALQDHHRALIVGERTFGKGSVQSVLPLRNGGGIKLTTALYYTPSGRSIQAEGIVPDVALDLNDDLNTNRTEGREADLAGHLPAETGADPSADHFMTGESGFPLQEIMAVLDDAGLLADDAPAGSD
ncbi:MAG: S41 family peptidase [Xanthomonadales bacterium]